MGLLEGLFAHSPVPYAIFDRRGRCTLTNQAYVQMFGASPPPDYDIFRDEVAQSVGIADLIHRAFQGETVQTKVFWYDPAELRHIQAEGTRRTAISCTLFPLTGKEALPAYVAIAYRDVTAATLGERAERQLVAITNNATLGLLLMDEKQQCVFMNPGAEKIIGFTLAEVRGKPLHDFIHHTRPDGSPYPMEECPIDRALPTRNQEQGEEVFVHPDGHFYPVAFTASPIVENGVPVGTVIELRDTTEEKRRESELATAVRVRDEFLSVASHELKTPLTPLSLRLQTLENLARKQPETPFVQQVLDTASRARRQVKRLSDLVVDLLDVSRIASGRLELHRERFDLGAMISDALAQFQDLAQRAGCELRHAVAHGLFVDADPARLEQVLTNLVDNALKYGAGGVVEVRLERVDETSAVLQVRDEGIGVPVQHLGRIFERFERAVPERNYGGLGLGLYITRTLVEAHGGTVTALSDGPATGATFRVLLPLCR